MNRIRWRSNANNQTRPCLIICATLPALKDGYADTQIENVPFYIYLTCLMNLAKLGAVFSIVSVGCHSVLKQLKCSVIILCANFVIVTAPLCWIQHIECAYVIKGK